MFVFSYHLKQKCKLFDRIFFVVDSLLDGVHVGRDWRYNPWNRGCTNGVQLVGVFLLHGAFVQSMLWGWWPPNCWAWKQAQGILMSHEVMDTYTLYWIFWCVPDESKNLDFCFNISMQRKHSSIWLGTMTPTFANIHHDFDLIFRRIWAWKIVATIVSSVVPWYCMTKRFHLPPVAFGVW